MCLKDSALVEYLKQDPLWETIFALSGVILTVFNPQMLLLEKIELPKRGKDGEKREFAGDFSTLWGVQIPPPHKKQSLIIAYFS